MKKFSSLLVIACAMLLGAPAAQAGNVVVNTNKELTNEFFRERTAEAVDTIFIPWTKDGLTMGGEIPASGRVYLIGQDNAETGERATLKMEISLPSNNSAGDHKSLIFENLIVKDSRGVAGSRHMIAAKDSNYHYMDTLCFRNCEITEINRTLFRMEPQKRHDGKIDAGQIDYIGMQNCRVHYGSMYPNAMPLFYIGLRVGELDFRNNTFYDLPYLKNLFGFGYLSIESERTDTNVRFENNTVIARSSQTLMVFNDYVGVGSTFHINNNFFLYPNWSDDRNNLIETSAGVYEPMTEEQMQNVSHNPIASIQYGVVEIKNNVIKGYTTPVAALDKDGTGDWLVADTMSYSMQDVDFSWDDMVDAKNDLFGIWKQHKVYTAGLNGAPIGDINNYTDEKQQSASISVSVEGSKTASVTIEPQQDKYLSGDKITLVANTNGQLNTFEGWSDGSTDLRHTLTLDGDLNISAKFKELPYVAAWNFKDLNNATPLAPDYGDSTFTLNYMTLSDGSYAQTNLTLRSNKVTGDVRNCFILSTDQANFASTEANHASYATIDVPAMPANASLQMCVATDNVTYKNYTLAYSTDGENWTDISTFQMDQLGAWKTVSFSIPSSLSGQKATLRIKGVEADGQYIASDLAELREAGLFEVSKEFMYISELYLLGGDQATGITTVSNNKPVKSDVIYNLAGQRVGKNYKGVVIINGKKYIAR